MVVASVVELNLARDQLCCRLGNCARYSEKIPVDVESDIYNFLFVRFLRRGVVDLTLAVAESIRLHEGNLHRYLTSRTLERARRLDRPKVVGAAGRGPRWSHGLQIRYIPS